ncbi:MAG: hypothetical protein ACKPEQ_30310, partial [Dolichospermum sp.]
SHGHLQLDQGKNITSFISRTMIYTSYYGGKQAGTPICISITQKHGYNFQELPLFKPSDALFKFWKNSKKDAEAEKHYTDVLNSGNSWKLYPCFWVIEIQIGVPACFPP